ncbi:MAG: endonuclease/exonuclease/phosphatase family protein [Clostridia bacterium]|nr:endonuclease/exonuclease/phosphatase family protein [Clostridia bacterium]
MKLKVGTYNVQHCSDNTVPVDELNRPIVRVDKIAQLLKDLGVEIVGLNEVYGKGPEEAYCDQARKLAEYFGAESYVFGQSKEFEWGDTIGNAVLSRYKIVDVQFYPVLEPTADERRENETSWYEDRVIVKATVDVGREICFLSTHFGLNGLEKERIVEKLVEVIDAETRPIILCGDFNVLPDQEYLKPIYQRLQSAADVVGKRSVMTWASFAPQLTIDYIFVSKEFTVKDYEVVDVVLSDHRPLWAELELSEK